MLFTKINMLTIGWFIRLDYKLMADWLTKLTNLLIDLTDKLTDWLADWLTDKLTDLTWLTWLT